MCRSRRYGPATRRISPSSTFPPPAPRRGPTRSASAATTLRCDPTGPRARRGHSAVGPWDPKLDPDTLRRMLRDMMLVRIFDDRMYRAQRQGKTSFYMKCTGEEAVAVAARLRARPRRHVLPDLSPAGPAGRARLSARRDDVPDLFEQRRPLKGRQLPIMYSDKEHGFFSISGNLATQFPQAVGWAMASAIKGDSRIAAGWIGDGATAEGDFHPPDLRRASIARRSSSTIVNNQWAISSFSGHRRRRARDLRRARGRLWHRRPARRRQ